MKKTVIRKKGGVKREEELENILPNPANRPQVIQYVKKISEQFNLEHAVEMKKNIARENEYIRIVESSIKAQNLREQKAEMDIKRANRGRPAARCGKQTGNKDPGKGKGLDLSKPVQPPTEEYKDEIRDKIAQNEEQAKNKNELLHIQNKLRWRNLSHLEEVREGILTEESKDCRVMEDMIKKMRELKEEEIEKYEEVDKLEEELIPIRKEEGELNRELEEREQNENRYILEEDTQEENMQEANDRLKISQMEVQKEWEKNKEILCRIENNRCIIKDIEEEIEEGNKILAYAGIVQHNSNKLDIEAHNKAVELRGNIRVFCRLRPLLPRELKEGSKISKEIAYHATDRKLRIKYENRNNEDKFEFDQVFGPCKTQEDIFSEISPFIKCMLDGFNACIFAYGQTGSGKTYTMEGLCEGDNIQMGVIPRSVQMIFTTLEHQGKAGWKFNIMASAIEIYRDIAIDLLHKGNICTETMKLNSFKPQRRAVDNKEDIFNILREANMHRATGETALNIHSSRSHLIFQLQINGGNEGTGEIMTSTLNLIDLAGSERVKESKAEGERFEETKAINKSLSHLKSVIKAIINKDEHVPYRNSKLTFLLEPHLGGNCKCLMLCNVTPNPAHVNETINSLKFAMEVNKTCLPKYLHKK